MPEITLFKYFYFLFSSAFTSPVNVMFYNFLKLHSTLSEKRFLSRILLFTDPLKSSTRDKFFVDAPLFYQNIIHFG